MLTGAILVLTAFAAGVTGAWSPCGFSMVETLGGAADRIGRRGVRLSCATFALGALAGGVATFGALALLGDLLGTGGKGLALLAAVLIAAAAALGEARGVRIVPQIRRQVPEPWRRTLPLPLAAGLYGVLLGLGFTTFVLTLAVWALAAISVAIGSPLAGLLIGLGFGAGRALPVIALAPRYATLGERMEERMCQEPALLRRLRLADAALLGALALTFAASGTAVAAPPTPVAEDGTDPSTAGARLAWRTPAGQAFLRDGDAVAITQASTIAIGGPYVAYRVGDRIAVWEGVTQVGEIAAPGATQIAVSRQWLVWRAPRENGGDRLHAATLPELRGARIVAVARGSARISRPALDLDRLAYAVASPGGSRIVTEHLVSGDRRTVLRSRLTRLDQPSLRRGRLLYVQGSFCSQRLRLTGLRAPHRPRTLLTIGSNARRDRGWEHDHVPQGSEPTQCPRGTPPRTDVTLWSTALGAGVAYVTLLTHGAGGAARTTLVRVPA